MAPKEVTKKEIENIIWKACDTFRGAIDPSEYKNYILTMLFIKYMSDLKKDKRETYEKKYKGDKARIERAMSRERFVVPEECDFDHLYVNREKANIGELINIGLENSLWFLNEYVFTIITSGIILTFILAFIILMIIDKIRGTESWAATKDLLSSKIHSWCLETNMVE